MSQQHTVRDKKTAYNFKIHCCRNYIANPKTFIFLHFLHCYWKPPESLGCKNIWNSMIDVKQGIVQQNRFKQLFGPFHACIKRTSG